MSRRRRGQHSPGPVHGIALLHKPSGPTSFTVMRQAERSLGAHKSGHGGTLDPMASGLLLVLLGEGTKLTPWVQGRDKRYRAEVTFGRATDTLDAEGAMTEEADVPDGLLEARLADVLPTFVGDRPQRPPKYSALKVGGRSHMSRARAGEEFEVLERPAHCYSITLHSLEATSATLELHVASGYYVRSLARDLGEALGVPAHLSALVRTSVGPWSLTDAVALEELTVEAVTPLERSLPDMPVITLNAADALLVHQGKRLPAQGDAACTMVLNPDGSPLAMVDRNPEGEWRVRRGFALTSQTVEKQTDSLIDKEALGR
ncbi:MAG: tRNA pseudouridine(55) synthase TruB [Myxococcota bacterium]